MEKSADAKVVVRRVEYGSAPWQETLELRERVLRKPLGLHLTAEELESQKDAVHFAAYYNEADKLVGTLLLIALNETRLQMKQVAVDSGSQRLGVGRIIVEHAESYAREHGFREMMLHGRESAIPFYERLGYHAVSGFFDEQTIPHREMIKQL